MEFKIRNHLLLGATQKSSPNSSDRVDENDISLIVIHNISLPPGKFGTRYIDQLFCNDLNPNHHPYFKKLAELKVSAHLLISRVGDVTQYVPLNKKAWHAGDSKYEERENCNEFSIGIELEGTDYEPYTDNQYKTLIHVTNTLLDSYPKINLDRIQGHSDIAPGRKTDPGPYFEWGRYLDRLD